MARPKQRTPELRDHVLLTAQNTLERHGIEGFTTKHIADDADTSVPAIYELFGDKAGLVRELFFVGFTKLAEALSATPTSDDPRANVVALAKAFRSFSIANPALANLMFSRSFASYTPSADDLAQADTSLRIVLRVVKRCIAIGVLHGDPIDVAHVLLGLLQGLVAQESAGWLGKSAASRNRRWDLALAMFFDGA
jgi:AcrR family transcriptional regulator